MDRQEQVRPEPAGNAGPFGEQQVTVAVTRHGDAHAAAAQQLVAQGAGEHQGQLLFAQAIAHRAGIVAAVSGIDDDQRTAGIGRTPNGRQADLGLGIGQLEPLDIGRWTARRIEGAVGRHHDEKDRNRSEKDKNDLQPATHDARA